MTTGTKVLDATIAYPTYDNPNSRWGMDYSKSWSGGNRPPSDYSYVIRVNPLTGKAHRLRVVSNRRQQPNDYDMVTTFRSQPVIGWIQGALWRYYSESVVTWSGAEPDWNGASPWTSNDDITLIAKFQERIYGSDFNPGVFLAELNQTLGLVGDLAVRLARVVSHVKKGNLKEAARIIARYEKRRPKRDPKRKRERLDSALSVTILEIQYGVRPLMQDMKEGAEWLAHMLHAPVSFRESVRRKVEKSVDPNWTRAASIQYAACTWEVSKQIIAYLTEPPHNAVLQSLLNPEQVIWEKVPFSFVADWAVPIGDYLQARGIASTLKGTFVTTTTERKNGSGFTGSPYGSELYTKPLTWWNLSGVDSLYREVRVTRRVTTALEVKLPVFKGFAKTFSWEHCLNGLALLTSVGSKTPDETLKAAESWLSKRIR